MRKISCARCDLPTTRPVSRRSRPRSWKSFPEPRPCATPDRAERLSCSRELTATAAIDIPVAAVGFARASDISPNRSPVFRSPLTPIFLVVAVDVFGMTLMIPLLPFYAQHYGASPLVVGILLATFAACQLISGPILG